VIALLGLAIANFPITLGQSDGYERWAVIAACCMYPTSPSNDAQYMYHVLSAHFDFDGIYYLDVRTGLPGVNASATRANLQWAIRNWLHDRSDTDDLIFIFCVGLGGGYNANMGGMEGGRIDGSQGDIVDEDAEHIIGGNWEGVDECIFFDTGPEYWDDELAVDLNTLTYSRLAFVRVGCATEEGNGGCFNGGLIDDISAPNRIVMTASNETWYCYADTDGDGFSEWPEAFTDALHGEDTFWDDATNTVVHTGTPIFADSDNNA
jgi:hypothetical protein